MDISYRRELVDVLMLVSATETEQGRTALLQGILNANSLSRNSTSRRSDLDKIVGQLAELAPDGALLRILIDNAVPYVRGVDAEERLLSLRDCTTPVPKFPDVADVDLTDQVDECLEGALSRKGLVGFAVDCDEYAFLDHFTARLKNKLGRDKTEVRQLLAIKPTLIDAPAAVKLTGRYKSVLKLRNVICPVRVELDDDTLACRLVQDFWQGLAAEYVEDCDHRLIVIIARSPALACPAGITPLTSPVFLSRHVSAWIVEVIRRLDWSIDVAERWKEKCLSECTGTHGLNIRLVYEHLAYYMTVLQRDPRQEAFLTLLQAR